MRTLVDPIHLGLKFSWIQSPSCLCAHARTMSIAVHTAGLAAKFAAKNPLIAAVQDTTIAEHPQLAAQLDIHSDFSR